MSSPMVRAARSSALLFPLLGVALAPSPAVAMTPEGWDASEPVSTLTALLLFGGIPLALFLGIVALTVAPSIARGSTPSVDRWATPQWFNGPSGGGGSKALPQSSARALPADGTGSGSARGYTAEDHERGLTADSHPGAGDTATPGAGVPAEHDVLAAASSPGGGASARW